MIARTTIHGWPGSYSCGQIWLPYFWGVGIGIVVVGLLGIKLLRGHSSVKGVLLGPGLMFATLTACFVVWLRPSPEVLSAEFQMASPEQAAALDRMTIANATVWSPYFWGIGVAIVVLGLLGMKFLQTQSK
jgi:hypothetical protein